MESSDSPPDTLNDWLLIRKKDRFIYTTAEKMLMGIPGSDREIPLNDRVWIPDALHTAQSAEWH